MNSARYIGVIEATSMSVRRYIELIGLRSCDSGSLGYKNTRREMKKTVYYFKHGT